MVSYATNVIDWLRGFGCGTDVATPAAALAAPVGAPTTRQLVQCGVCVSELSQFPPARHSRRAGWWGAHLSPCTRLPCPAAAEESQWQRSAASRRRAFETWSSSSGHERPPGGPQVNTCCRVHHDARSRACRIGCRIAQRRRGAAGGSFPTPSATPLALPLAAGDDAAGADTDETNTAAPEHAVAEMKHPATSPTPRVRANTAGPAQNVCQARQLSRS